MALSEAGGHLTASFGTRGVDRADVEVDGRPRFSADLGGDPVPVEVAGCAGAAVVRVRGYDAGELVALRTFVRKGSVLEPLGTLDA